MASFHEQWMSVRERVAALPESEERAALLASLSRARELIREENKSSEKREGGEIIRWVGLRAREMAA